MQKKRRHHEEAHSQPGTKADLVDAEERALEIIKDAIDRELFAGLSQAPANLPSLFESYCFHAGNRNARSSSLKYFVRLAGIGAAYPVL